MCDHTTRIRATLSPPTPLESRRCRSAVDPARSRAIDRIVTFALLAYALVNVAVAALALVDFSQYAATVEIDEAALASLLEYE